MRNGKAVAMTMEGVNLFLMPNKRTGYAKHKSCPFGSHDGGDRRKNGNREPNEKRRTALFIRSIPRRGNPG